MTDDATSQAEQQRRTGGAGPVSALALVLSFVYVWLRVDVGLLYFWPGATFPSFAMTRLFAGDFVLRAGGPVQYAAAFLSQLYYYPWLGALVITGVVGALCAGVAACIRTGCGRAPRLLHLVPLPLVLVICNQYGHHLATLIALALASWAAVACSRFERRGAAGRLAAFVVVGGAVYYLAAGGFLVFAVLCAGVELGRGRMRGAAARLLVGAALPYVAATWVLPVRLRDAYGYLLPFHPAGDPTGAVAAAGICAFVCLCVPLAWAAALLMKRVEAAPGKGRLRLSPTARSLVLVAVVTAAAVACVQLTFNGTRHARLTIERCARTEAWDELLEARVSPGNAVSDGQLTVEINGTTDWKDVVNDLLSGLQTVCRQLPAIPSAAGTNPEVTHVD